MNTTRTLALLVAGILVGGLVGTALVLVISGVTRDEAPTAALGVPSFVDESDSDRIDQVYDGEFQFFVGGGVAVLDCNDDNLADLYFAGGTNQAGLYINKSTLGGALQFEPVEGSPAELTDVTGAYPIDVDSDGITDLAVLRVGENMMLRGTGNCGFEEANELWGVDGGKEWTASFSAKWEEGESLPTMAFGSYLTVGDRDRCDEHYLLRPDQSTYPEPTPLSPGRCTLSILFSDWNRSGDRDLRMTNDRHYYTDGEEQMWRVDPDEAPALYTRDDGWETLQIWGMGIASQDVTGDGLPEVFLTSQGDNKLQTLAGDPGRPSYEDIALEAGATAHRPFAGDTNRPSTAWHAEFGDVNNDGFMDLLVTKGNVEAMADFATEDPNNLLIGQPDGTFVEGATEANLVDYGRSRGASLTDLNLDGMLDVVVVERRQPVKLWRNTGEAGNWLAVDVRQPAPNTNAIGAWVEVKMGNTVIPVERTIGGGHAGGELGTLHFGIGRADTAEVRVIWPDGEEGDWMNVEANQSVVLDRESGTVAISRPG